MRTEGKSPEDESGRQEKNRCNNNINYKHVDDNLANIFESFKSFISRFDIKCENEEAILSLSSGDRWWDFTSNPDNFETTLRHNLYQLNGKPWHLYRGTGTFKKGSIKLEKGKIIGRNVENLLRILEITLDCDAISYLLYKQNIDPRDPQNKERIEDLKRELYHLPDERLNDFLNQHFGYIKRVFDEVEFIYSQIIRSGYGHYVKIFVMAEDQSRIHEIRNFHKRLVSYLNEIAGFDLCDRQCTDAGTRVIRIEQSYNVKNPNMPRLVHTLESNSSFYSLDGLIDLIRENEGEADSNSGQNGHQSNFPCTEITKIVQPYYKQGQRQALTLSLTGLVAKNGGTIEDAKIIVASLAKQNFDEELNKRLGAVDATFKKFIEGKSINGYRGLEILISKEAMQEITNLISTYSLKFKGLTVAEIKSMKIDLNRFIVKPAFAMKGGITIISGDPGAGKTWLTLEITRCIVNGDKLFGQFDTEKGIVAYFDQENPFSVLQERVKLLKIPNIGCKFYHYQNINIEKNFVDVLNLAKEFDLMIFDSLAQFHDRNEDKASEIKFVMSKFREIARKCDCGIMLLHQRRKPGQFESNELYTARGSLQIIYDSDIAFTLRKDKNDVRILEAVKNRVVREPKPIQFEIVDIQGQEVKLEYLGEFEEIETKKERALLHIPIILQDSQESLPWEMIQSQLKDNGIDISEATLRPILRDLEEDGIIKSEPRQRGKKFYSYLHEEDTDK